MMKKFTKTLLKDSMKNYSTKNVVIVSAVRTPIVRNFLYSFFFRAVSTENFPLFPLKSWEHLQ
jgi:hypothetical protein